MRRLNFEDKHLDSPMEYLLLDESLCRHSPHLFKKFQCKGRKVFLGMLFPLQSVANVLLYNQRTIRSNVRSINESVIPMVNMEDFLYLYRRSEPYRGKSLVMFDDVLCLERLPYGHEDLISLSKKGSVFAFTYGGLLRLLRQLEFNSWCKDSWSNQRIRTVLKEMEELDSLNLEEGSGELIDIFLVEDEEPRDKNSFFVTREQYQKDISSLNSRLDELENLQAMFLSMGQ